MRIAEVCELSDEQIAGYVQVEVCTALLEVCWLYGKQSVGMYGVEVFMLSAKYVDV